MTNITNPDCVFLGNTNFPLILDCKSQQNRTVFSDQNFVGKMSHDRRAMDELKDQKRTVERNIGELLDEGLNFYLAMIDTLDNTYGIGGLEKYYDVLEPRSR